MAASTFQHCSVFARNAGDDPGGSATPRTQFYAIELPLPWPHLSIEASAMTPGLRAVVDQLQDLAPGAGSCFIAPDPEYSVEGMIRIIALGVDDGPGGAPTHRDVLAPAELAGEALRALINVSELPAGAVVSPVHRDLLVCTHGARDACCATFGFPLYRDLRAEANGLRGVRVWRASHFGGHRFAPTMLDLSDGRSWGFLDRTSASAVLRRSGEPRLLRHCYRGWMGHDERALQLLDREAFVTEGWSWLEAQQEMDSVDWDGDEGPPRAVAIAAQLPNGDRVRYDAIHEQLTALTTLGACNGDPLPVPRGRLVDVRRTELAPAGAAD